MEDLSVDELFHRGFFRAVWLACEKFAPTLFPA